jgi:hypothetical protein
VLVFLERALIATVLMVFLLLHLLRMLSCIARAEIRTRRRRLNFGPS